MTRRWINKRVVSEWCHLRQRYVTVEKEGYWYDGPVAEAEHITPALECVNHRVYDDDAGEATSTALADADTNVTLAQDKILQYRMWIRETAGGEVNNQQSQLEYRKDTGGGFGAWTDVTTTSNDVRAVAGSFLTNEGTTTQRDSSGTYITPNNGQCTDGQNGNDAENDFTANSSIEYCYCVQLRSADLNDGDDIQIRATEVSGTTITQNQTQLTITIGAAGPTELSAQGAINFYR